MVEILLQSAKDEALSQTLPTNGQNMWHIISDFKPFNNEIWDEYIEDIIERLLTLNIPINKDNNGRSPVHYAAKHGQTILLRRLLVMPNITKYLNTADEEGKSELYYAVESLNYDSVKVIYCNTAYKALFIDFFFSPLLGVAKYNWDIRKNSQYKRRISCS